jgi:hypothetical protein
MLMRVGFYLAANQLTPLEHYAPQELKCNGQ